MFVICFIYRCNVQFTEENEKAQRYLLGGFEQLVGKVHPDVLLPKVSKILSEFYQHDILSEEVILDWAKKVCLNWCLLLC